MPYLDQMEKTLLYQNNVESQQQHQLLTLDIISPMWAKRLEWSKQLSPLSLQRLSWSKVVL